MITQPKIEKPRKNDIIIYDGEKWVNVNKGHFLNDLQKEVNLLKAELENAKIELKKAQNTIMELASIMKGE